MTRSGTVSIQYRLRLIGALALMALGAGTTTSFASEEGTVVRYHATDLATDAGARHLLGQIETAAHRACFDQEFQPLPLRQASRRCYQAAVSNAVDTVHAAKVTAAYVAKYGNPALPGMRAAHAAPRTSRGT